MTTASPHEPRRPPWPVRLATLAFAHTTIDVYGTFLAAILVVVMAPKLALSDSAAAGILSLSVAVQSLGQPLFAYLSDRRGGRFLVILSPAVAALSAGSFLAAPSVGTFLLLVIAQAAALAAFHPEGAALAASLAERHAASSTAIFMAAGPLGQTLGPLLITWAAAQPSPPAWLPLWGVAVSALLWFAFPAHAVRHRGLRQRGDLRRALRGQGTPLTLLTLISASRYFVITGLQFGLPLLLLERLPRADALRHTGWWLSIVLAGITLGGLVGSATTRRGRRRRVTFLSFALAAPLLAALPHLEGGAALLTLGAAGLALGWTSPLVVIMGQLAVPRAAAMASALMLGVSWSLGGPIAPLAFAQVRALTSTPWAVTSLAVASAIAALAALFLPAELEDEKAPAPDS